MKKIRVDFSKCYSAKVYLSKPGCSTDKPVLFLRASNIDFPSEINLDKQGYTYEQTNKGYCIHFIVRGKAPFGEITKERLKKTTVYLKEIDPYEPYDPILAAVEGEDYKRSKVRHESRLYIRFK